MKIHPVGAGLFRANRWTDMTKLTVTFCNFVKAPKPDFSPYFAWADERVRVSQADFRYPISEHDCG